VLPVTLLTFDAAPVDNSYIGVTWATATEVDNRGFELQRSTDRVNFQTIKWIDGVGNSSVTTTYGFDDHEVDRNVMYYYRLKQVGFDGSITYSHIDAASLTGDVQLVVGEFYPNPTLNTTSLDILSPSEGIVGIEVYDGLGRLIKVSQAYIGMGPNTLNLNLEPFAHGTYMVRLAVNGVAFPKRVVKIQ
jgi:hypothetical protein